LDAASWLLPDESADEHPPSTGNIEEIKICAYEWERHMSLKFDWYVAFSNSENGPTLMRLTMTKDEAINAACQMLSDGINVREIGPMLAPIDGGMINSNQIRQLHARRAQLVSAAK
jgi:hypothetical protein